MASPRTILVVDDEFSIVESLVEILSWEGFSVVTAANGRDGLEALKRVKPDLVLLDYMMPLMDGVQMLRALRQLEGFEALPVVLMTAAPMDVPPQERQWSALLRKPFQLQQLQRILQKLLGPPGGR